MPSFTNPIIPGFYPDPSCIRVGDAFYMANSSFQFFPGIPIHKSKDLINWELIGNAINRPSQISLNQATTKINNASRREIFTGGIYAPTIRYHDGVFYIICTNLTGAPDMPSSTDFHPSNFIITATDLSNPDSFSELIYFDFHGIDPSLFFDKDGRVYVQGSWIYGYNQNPATVIRQAEINVSTGQLLSEARDIWSGATGKVPEGPHIYHKDGWYYLLIAEGGTHARHKITMARSRSIWGPFESDPANPVLTAEGPNGVVQCVGHGDLVQDQDGQWWCVMLARREYGGSYPLGRETFLTSVEWVDGNFPVFKDVEIEQGTGRQVATKAGWKQSVGVDIKSPTTLYLRTPHLENYRQDGNQIILTATDAGLRTPNGTMTFVGRRQTSLDSTASVTILLSSVASKDVSYGLTLYKDVFRYAVIQYRTHDSTLALVVQEAGESLATLSSHPVQDAASIRLSIISSVETYKFRAQICFANVATTDIMLGEVPCSIMSGDDFTGTVYGIFSSGDGSTVTFRDFEIESR
ncbi:glycosyl hydrolase [Aspergillus pseudotamarii]|uniref:Glycosyl hydrolase n=1 Tax=Aspergillus pseudotamarii TaxID=132259 RepID=A0A5N6T1B6_ASPPS|nr:glycosyl hydrolase [Aspergillus pseudotamarii]KAE8139853.1 glycosyl hydrolase [Aspergillus pseudotamarii]